MALVESFSGIRGIYGRDLTEGTARRYAYCLYSFLKERLKRESKIVIGHDTRESSSRLKDAVIDVFPSVIDVGVSTTPAIELAVREYRLDGGIIITASHNPKEYNGFKFLGSDGAVLRPKDVATVIEKFNEIKNLTEEDFLNKCLHKESAIKLHKVEKKHNDLVERYNKYLLKIIGRQAINLIKHCNLKIILDPNGGAAITLKPIFEKIGVKVVEINNKAGEFKRKIEPNAESLACLKEEIKKHSADFAAGFDCDGDRVELILPNGSLVSGHYLVAIVADEILSGIDAKNKIVVTNDAASGVLKEVCERYEAKIEEVEVGEINVVDAMLRHNSPIGGEGSASGVIIPPSRCRDGALTLLFILKIMAKKAKPLQQIVDGYPKYYNIREAVKFNPKELAEIREKIKSHYLGKGYTIKETGGITGGLKVVVSKKSFVWFRASKTEANMFRIIADSDSETEAERLLKEGVGLVH